MQERQGKARQGQETGNKLEKKIDSLLLQTSSNYSLLCMYWVV